jgi:hypothetical protein
VRANAQTADLIDSLREFVASADGDKPSTAPAQRDSPGARSAAAASARGGNVDDGNTGQWTTSLRGRSRRDTLPDDHQVAVRLAEQLLKVLVKATLSSPASPGEESAARSGGPRVDRAGRWGRT